MNFAATLSAHANRHMDSNNAPSRIAGEDIAHMHAFPPGKKQDILDKIMSRTANTSVSYTGHNQYEKLIFTLRKNGFQLIDLQPQEFVLTSVWCKSARTMMGLRRTEVAMLLWVVEEASTSVSTWHI